MTNFHVADNKDGVVLPAMVYDLARQARNIVVEFAKLSQSPGNPKTLEGYCAIGSHVLWKLAKRKRLANLHFVQGVCVGAYDPDSLPNHSWCVYETQDDEIIIDVTGTQFNFLYPYMDENQVVLASARLRASSMPYFLRVDDMIDDALEEYVSFHWPKNQRPHTYRNSLDALISKHRKTKFVKQ
jgi:hypothetical protein